jgi:23S rRNA (guanosine2251-2'-O)-methyltransferase
MELVLTRQHAIEEHLKRHKSAIAFLYEQETQKLMPLLSLASKYHIPCRQVNRAKLKEMGAFHMALIIDHQVQSGLPWFKEQLNILQHTSRALIVVLDGINDPHNMGAILRSCALFDVDLVIYPSRRSAPADTQTVLQVSSGGATLVPHGDVGNLQKALELCKQYDFWIYGMDMSGKDLAKSLPMPSHSVLIMGAEGQGMSALHRKTCDHLVSIPTNQKLDSLNVSVAAGIALSSIYAQHHHG